MCVTCFFFFFKQKTAYEILALTGVQTCALPIFVGRANPYFAGRVAQEVGGVHLDQRRLAARGQLEQRPVVAGSATAGVLPAIAHQPGAVGQRSETRRVGKECRTRWAPCYL